VAPGEEPPAHHTVRGKERARGKPMTRRNEKILFSLEGVDLNDDAALEEFARQVWERVTAAWGEREDA